MAAMITAEVLNPVLVWIPQDKLLKIRLVCKEWARLVGGMKSMEGFIYSVDATDDSITTFRALSPNFEVKQFRFANQNFEGSRGLLQDRQTFRVNHCPRIRTIYLINCNISGGTLFEFLSHCCSLKSLAIQQCPSIYRTTLSCLGWRFNFHAVKKNLAGLTTLKLAEKVIAEKDLWGLTCEMKTLKSFTIAVNDGFLLPRHAIIRLLRSNSETLKELSLIGKLFNEKISEKDLKPLDDFPEMKALKRIDLRRGLYNSVPHSMVLECMFKVSPKLSQLFITHATFQPEAFTSIQDSLVRLELWDCSLHRLTFDNLKFPQLRHFKLIQRNDRQPIATEEAIMTFLGRARPNLDTFEVALVKGGSEFLQALTLVPARFPKLTALALSDLNDISTAKMRRIFKQFPGLEHLALTNSAEFGDETFCAGQICNEMGCLASLKNLRSLNLSGTKVSNSTIEECLPSWAQMEVLTLNNTKVNKFGLEKIFEAVKFGWLPVLSFVDLDGSPCEMSEIQLQTLVESIAPRYIDVSCAITV